jgi:hypothetical protein
MKKKKAKSDTYVALLLKSSAAATHSTLLNSLNAGKKDTKDVEAA